MSKPLTRRLAGAALLLAAGAAPVIGAAGAANAAELPSTQGLGVSSLDGDAVGSTVDGAAKGAAQTLGETGGKAVGKAAPEAGKLVGHAGHTVAPVTERAGNGDLLGGAGKTVSGSGKGGGLTGGLTGILPTKGLPLG
ncbi:MULTISPECIES: hypothetical protein [unclassified Streptomyces]|uniref:ATP-binding protein n=1 Tax=Streptomyces evansiae TaxID=3075535 RepID=A0ABU2R2C6_9ACTN|nr:MULTISPECIES: hypothetical protein [unclassified Streptomyces]MDT0410269.1 hypothetical protein [Streptomyces sp. DSM 41979]MDT0423725.1 hypothetical protein [Streptomyces sp. DSM 41859]MYQ58870.1 hypothetical protein [Streptomyces sp. SID4926]MYR25811.1 hypothetical protein [Streptomyces sp. SID4945]WEH29651.1 hypothetical protein P0D76_21305 [Streptomyces sp. AM 3-1-1]